MIKVRRIVWLVLMTALINLEAVLAGIGSKNSVGWLSPEEMSARYAISPRPIIVDVYTDWCYYCKVMDNTTWQNDSVVNYLKEKFYTVKLNAESRDSYQWMGEKFDYVPKYKLNTLAIKLLQGNIVYPSTVIIPLNGEPEVLRGAFTAAELEMVLRYYGEKWNETLTPDKFQKKFSGKWK